ncbi:hypothetical protein ACFPA8_10075 [Streptomyces ovatisporus]|uniref:Uncharacterized protein n=1 Tax=Streptomyces ovatisporus TaxID=1128682 RepID=A0ABV9A4D5_9ACTN
MYCVRTVRKRLAQAPRPLRTTRAECVTLARTTAEDGNAESPKNGCRALRGHG